MDFNFDSLPGVPVIAPALQQIAQQAVATQDHIVPLPLPVAPAPSPSKSTQSNADKPFVCSHPTCSKAFARKSDMIRHVRIVRGHVRWGEADADSMRTSGRSRARSPAAASRSSNARP